MTVFPNEIFIKIIDYAAGDNQPGLPDFTTDHIWPCPNRETLCNLALVNSTFRHFAHKHLFRCLVFRQNRKKAILERVCGIASSPTSAYIRHLCVFASAYNYIDNHRPNITKAHVFLSAFDSLISRCSPNLQSLSFVGFSISPKFNIELLVALLLQQFSIIIGTYDLPQLQCLRAIDVQIEREKFLTRFYHRRNEPLYTQFAQQHPGFSNEKWVRNMSRIKEWVVADKMWYRKDADELWPFRQHQRRMTDEVINAMLSISKEGESEGLRSFKWDAPTSQHISLEALTDINSLTTLHISRVCVNKELCSAVRSNANLIDVELRIVHIWDAKLEGPWSMVFTELQKLAHLKSLILHGLGYGDVSRGDCLVWESLHSDEYMYSATITTGQKADLERLRELWVDMEKREGVAKLYPLRKEDMVYLFWNSAEAMVRHVGFDELDGLVEKVDS